MLEQTETKQQIAALPTLGTQYPRQWLGFIAEYGYKAVSEYLQRTQAPAEVVELAEALAMTNQFMAGANGEMVTDSGDFIGGVLAAIGRGVLAVGNVELSGPDGDLYIPDPKI